MNIRITFASGVVALWLALLTIGPASAQEATPETEATPVAPITEELEPWVVSAPYTPQPDECTADEVDTVSVATVLGTPIPVAVPEITANGIEAVEFTGLADPETIDGVLETLGLLWACTNAGDRAAVASLLTPNAFVEWFGIDPTLSGEDLQAAVDTALAPGGDRADGEQASIDGVLTIGYLPDGRTAALVLNTDPRVAGADQVLDLFLFVNLNGVYQIDSIVFDPFDLTPGYGFEKG